VIRGLEASYLGNGAVKDMNFTANGTVFIEPRSEMPLQI